jgi:arsenite/tail-anchored protein-transporting ATPase
LRLLLFTGKGGVGKTTVAAATAVHAARCGVKTLVLSTDAAHSLGDTLGARLGPQPDEVIPGLSAQQVDPRSRGEQAWAGVQDYLFDVLDALGVEPLLAEELTALPGVEEVLALLEVRDQVRHGGWDLVVVDCGPTADTVRLLALPEALAGALDRMLPLERRVARALAATARGSLPAPGDDVVEAATRLRGELAGARDVLAAPQTSVRLVLTPESVVVAETLRTWSVLALYGYRADAVVANRVVPDGGDDPWRHGWARTQQELLAELAPAVAPAPVLRLGYAVREPVGVPALATLGEDLYGPAVAGAATDLLDPPDPASGPARGVEVEREGAHFVLTLDLPLARREDLGLARHGDDLVLTVGPARRVLPLPSALRRCRVLGATLRDGRLRVRFEPDPDLWPTR